MTAPQIPVIDLAPWWGTAADRRAVGHEVDAAARRFGFFQVVGHRLPAERVDAMVAAELGGAFAPYIWTPHPIDLRLALVDYFNAARRSAAFFLDGNWDAVIECLPTCTSTDRPPRYAPVTAGQHLTAKLMGPRLLRASDAVDTSGDCGR